jgi:cytoskeletal protein CcmA (bactofilin family)
MFSKKPGQDVAGKTGPHDAKAGGPASVVNRSSREGAEPTVIGFGLAITGNLESKGEIQVEGAVQGDIHGGRIVVGEQALIQGNLVANDIIVRGTLRGSIRGNNVTVHSSSRVEGDIFHKLLTMEQGAFFEGRARRSTDPLTAQVVGAPFPPAGTLHSGGDAEEAASPSRATE